MQQVSYIIPIRRMGKSLAAIFDRKFCSELKISENDFLVPCSAPLSKIEKIKGETDPVLGDRKLVFRLVRAGNKPLTEILVIEDE